MDFIKTKWINPNILDEGNHMVVLEENEDEMEMIVLCNNCGQPTKYGQTRMISGFVGCDNKIKVHGKEVECYFGDLQPRVLDWKENHYDMIYTGQVRFIAGEMVQMEALKNEKRNEKISRNT